MTNVQQSLEMETNLSLLGNKSGKGLINNLKALKNTITDLTVPQDGDAILLPRRTRLRHYDGNRAATCGQLGAGIRGNHHPGLNSEFCFFSCSNDVISLARNLICGQSTGCKQYTYRAHFSNAQLLCSHLVNDLVH